MRILIELTTVFAMIGLYPKSSFSLNPSECRCLNCFAIVVFPELLAPELSCKSSFTSYVNIRVGGEVYWGQG